MCISAVLLWLKVGLAEFKKATDFGSSLDVSSLQHGLRLLVGHFFLYHEATAEDSHVSGTITGERKVKGTCYFHSILMEIQHTCCSFIHNCLSYASIELKILQTTMQRILNHHLKLYAYKTQTVKPLDVDSRPHRKEFAVDRLIWTDNDNSFLDTDFFNNELILNVTGMVNRHNSRIWGSENPHVVHDYEHGNSKLNM
jgi:hypothetical protein